MSYRERFSTYFAREVAERAARPLSDGVEIELKIGDERLTFTRNGGRNEVRDGAARDPQVVFSLTPKAADAILDDPAAEIGTIGVNIGKLIVSSDPGIKVGLQLKAGLMSLWNKGYFGVIGAGGAQFAGFLASKGLNGIGAIKEAVKKMKA
ncbi:MAG TPA: hypothetical protein VM598_04315 [Bdellovibrionota bacterium]|nr:hypothetical protein [Bdellovibrionota bacterium]